MEKFGDGPEPPGKSNMHSKPGVGFVILHRKQLAELSVICDGRKVHNLQNALD